MELEQQLVLLDESAEMLTRDAMLSSLLIVWILETIVVDICSLVVVGICSNKFPTQVVKYTLIIIKQWCLSLEIGALPIFVSLCPR